MNDIITRLPPEPAPGSLWRHYNGVVYVVEQVTNRLAGAQDRYPATVVYRGTMNGQNYSRALADWRRSMTPIGNISVILEEHTAYKALIGDMTAALDAARRFIEQEFHDPTLAGTGEWLSREARGPHAAICEAIEIARKGTSQ